jgi:hypothetical protein
MLGAGDVNVYGPLSVNQIKALLNSYGPIMVGIYANSAFMRYASGVFTGCPSNAANFLNHAVLLVGYNDTEQSWLLKNQWDKDWGEQGYIRVWYFRDCGLSYLLGNIEFTSYFSNPSVTIEQPQLLVINQNNAEIGMSLILSALLLIILINL